jgi:hypothetical protein
MNRQKALTPRMWANLNKNIRIINRQKQAELKALEKIKRKFNKGVIPSPSEMKLYWKFANKLG